MVQGLIGDLGQADFALQGCLALSFPSGEVLRVVVMTAQIFIGFRIPLAIVNAVHDAEQIIASLPVHTGENVFATDLDGLVKELRANPWVASAEAHRELPHTLAIVVQEHVPAAVVTLGGLYLVDPSGHPFKKAELAADDGAGLPIITGLDRGAYSANPDGTAAQIRDALDALAKWRDGNAERPSIGELHLDTHGGLTLVTYEHAIAIDLGDLDKQLPQRMQTFDATWAELTASERNRTRAIHLDARADQVTVAFAQEKVQ